MYIWNNKHLTRGDNDRIINCSNVPVFDSMVS